jgi:DNA-binding SARP family transcriptional activator/DNA-binding beta-propeller fold protein YncE
MDFRILGPLEVLEEERVLDVGRGKQRSVLALLLLHVNEVVSNDRLVDELWPNKPPPTATKIIQAHVSRLRKALDAAGGDILLTRGPGYLLRVEPGQLDVDRFRTLLEQGRGALAAGDADAAAATLRAALALWRGPPLAEFAYDSFAQEEIARLEELHLDALEERIEAELALGRHHSVVQELEQLVRQHPLRERLRGDLMLALYRAGRQAEALEVYREARRTLAEELGLEPSPTLQQLERAILAHDPALRTPARGRAEKGVRSRRHVVIAGGVVALVVAAITVAVLVLSRGETPGLDSLAPDSVGVIDPATNRIVGQIQPVGATPTRIAFGREGVWVVSPHDKTITHIDPKTRTALRTISAGGAPTDVAVGERAVWVLLAADTALGPSPARVARIDPRLNDLLPPIPLGIGPRAFTSSGGGGSIAVATSSVWVVNPNPQVVVTRIDATTGTVKKTFTVGRPGSGFDSGTAGGVPGSSGVAIGFRALWIGGNTGLVRIDARSNSVSAPIGLGVVVPTAIAVGEGAVWVAARPGFRCCPPEDVGTGTLTRIDPETNSVEATISVRGEPAAVAVGEGAVWIADRSTESIIRVDPEKNQEVGRIRVGARPRGIAVGGGFVWVSVS